MLSLKQFTPFRSKSQSKNIACYEGYVRGYQEGVMQSNDYTENENQRLRRYAL